MAKKAEKFWYSTKAEMNAAKGDCDYVYFDSPYYRETHFGGGVMKEDISGGYDSTDIPGMTYFFEIDTYIPDEECENGIFIAMDDYEAHEVDGDGESVAAEDDGDDNDGWEWHGRDVDDVEGDEGDEKT